MSHLEYGSVVWVRLGQAWWPGTITTVEKCPPDFVEGLRKTPVAVVKFFRENEFQDVHKEEHIYPYSCDRKEEFIRRGQYINKNQSHGEVDLLRKFESDVVTAEKLTGGDMNILQTMGEVVDTPTNSRIFEPDLSSDPHSTHIERPQGCLPGEVVIGEPEGPTPFDSGKMRSPHSNNTQLVDVGEQEASDDSDSYIEDDYDQVPPTLPREMPSLDVLKASSHLADSHKHSQSQSCEVRSQVASVDEKSVSGRSECYKEVVQTSSTSMLHDMQLHSSAQYGPPRAAPQIPKETNLKLSAADGHFTKASSDRDPKLYESRKVVGYPVGVVPQPPETVKVGSESQSPEIVKEESGEVVEDGKASQLKYSEVAQNQSLQRSMATDRVVSQSSMFLEDIVGENKQEVPERFTIAPHGHGVSSKVTDSEVSNVCNMSGSNHINTKNVAVVQGEADRSHRVVEVQNVSEVSHASKISNDGYINRNNESNGKCPKPVQDTLVLSNPVRNTNMVQYQSIDDRESESIAEHISDVKHVKENGSRSEQVLPVTNKNTVVSEIRRELPDQSDSEQLVTSSGMGEDVDDSHQIMDESCDSSASNKVGLDTSREGESDHEVTLGESCTGDPDLSYTRDEVEEADSSLSEFEESFAKMDASMSENEAFESNTEVRRETIGESGMQQKNVPKRKREPSQKRSKKLKVGKKQDGSEEPAEDSDELPDLLRDTTSVDNKKLKVGDLVWVKYRKDWWPSYIKNVYPRDKKFSIVFVACDQNSGIRVFSRNVKKLHIWDVPSYVNQNQEGFSSALHLCKLFQQILEQGNEITAHDFFSRSPQAQVALLNQKKMPKNKASSEPRKQKPKVQVVCETPKKLLFDDPDYESEMSAREKTKLQSALKARKADNQKLVKFMKSHQCIEHLWKIYKEEISNERHNKFKDEESRKSLLLMGIGPFQLDDEDDQIISVINVFKQEILSKDPQVSNARDYVIQVWIPEAIKEALRVVKKVPENELDEALYKGYRETAIEKRARQLSF
ncbi:serine-rich adhesin for platelets-like [Macrobrachium rosenbergii]|uniref:serine-rich adhesin for platelets-like n=1 Tax=Macrobrachium rosenbergii TaxID=79674 RepID=UPI0034D6C902